MFVVWLQVLLNNSVRESSENTFASSYKMYTETFLIFMFCVSNVIIKSNKIFLFQFYDCIIRHKRFLPTNVNARASALLIFLAHFGHDVSLSVRMTAIGDMLLAYFFIRNAILTSLLNCNFDYSHT